ncbi:MAG: AMP-binding protein [Rhodobacteraceae bacterium]|nr:AMP-binding protein [Paracoccaceae bacterium]
MRSKFPVGNVTRLEDCFRKATTAHLLTRKSASVVVLEKALMECLSLTASPLSDAPLQIAPGTPQRLYCESSGSSGTPKLIRRTPASWMASFEVNTHRFNITPRDRYAVLGHLGHSLSLYAAIEAMHIGCGLAVLNDLAPLHQAAALRAHRISILYATPSQLRLICKADADPLPSVSRILCGGGHLDTALRDQLAVHFPDAQVVEFFGASETSFISISDSQSPRGSVGHAFPGVTLRIGDGLAQGQMGEIWVKSPYLFDGYEKGDSPLTRWQDGYLSIGELGKLDEAGNLFLQGRLSRMVTVADQNVFPEAIEAVIMAQPGIDAAAIITPDDPLRGSSIVAAIVGDVSESALRQICRTELGDASVPRYVWVLDTLPMLPAGKPDLKRLETLWRERTI